MNSGAVQGGQRISPSTRDEREDRVEPVGSAEGDSASGSRRAAVKRPPWHDGDRGVEGSFGTWLRRQREMREIDLREIAERTKISLRYLKAMEQDRFELLPAPVFAKGFLREYAKYVGLSPDEVVNYYLSASGEQEPADEDQPTEVERRGKLGSPWSYGVFLVLLLILVVAVAAYLAFYTESRRNERQAPPPPIAAPPAVAPRLPAEPPPAEVLAEAPAAPLEVTLDFTQECWVEVVVDGRERISELHAPGESLQIAAQKSVLLANVGNASGVEVQVNGAPFDLGVGDRQVVRDVLIDLETAGVSGGEGDRPPS